MGGMAASNIEEEEWVDLGGGRREMGLRKLTVEVSRSWTRTERNGGGSER